MTADVVAKYQARVVHLLVAFGNELLDTVRDVKHVNVEDVRRDVVGVLQASLDDGTRGGDGDDDDELLAAMMSFDTPALDTGIHPSGMDSGSKFSSANTIVPS